MVSLGGGAVIDAGKAIAALVPAAGPVIDYLEVVGTGRRLEAQSPAVRGDPHHHWHEARRSPKCGDQRSGGQQRKVSHRTTTGMLPDTAIVDRR